MISPRSNFSLIKAKFHELAPAINKGAGFRQRRSNLIHSSPAVLGRPRPCWFGKLIPEVSSAHMVSISSLSAELVRFWKGPLLQPGPDQQPEHSRPPVKSHHLAFLEAVIKLGQRGQAGTGHTGTKRMNVLVVKLRQISVFARNYFPAGKKKKKAVESGVKELRVLGSLS